MTANLDMPLEAVFADRVLLNRVVRSIQLDAGIDYVAALERLHQAVDTARSIGKDPTLGGALKRAGNVADLQDTIRLLERRDAAVEAVYAREAEPIMLERVDGRGQVMLDQGATARSDTGTDIGKALADPEEFERRLARIRLAQPGHWGSDEGREKFRQLDRQHLEAGMDLVRTAERQGELAVASAKARRVAAELDQVIAAASEKRQRLEALDAKLDELGNLPGAQDIGRAKLREQIAEVNQAPLRLLDRLAPETPPEAPAKFTANELRKKIRQLNRRKAVSPDYEVRELDNEIAQFTTELVELQADATKRRLTQPGTHEPTESEPGVPPGVHPGSHSLDQRVRQRMRELDRPASEYERTLLEVYKEL